MNIDLNKLGGRKFIMGATTGFSICVLVWFAKISGEVFEVVMLGTVGAYMAGNVVERIKAPPVKAK